MARASTDDQEDSVNARNPHTRRADAKLTDGHTSAAQANGHGDPESLGPTGFASGGARITEAGQARLAEQAEEMALQLECVKLTDEELPLGLAYKRFLDLVHRAIPFEHGTVYVTEWESGRLIPVAIRGMRIDLADQVRFARGAGLSAWVAQERRPVVIPDPEADGADSPFADGAVRAFLAFPLLQNGVVAGVVALARGDRTFSLDEFARLDRLAELLANTLAKLRREARLRELIYLDSETGLSNQRYFVARIEEELQRARQHAVEFSVALLEIHAIEDAVGPGRSGGAQLIQAFTQRLQGSMRTCDMAASLDDGRFGLLLAGVNHHRAAGIVTRIAGAVLADNLNLSDQSAVQLRVGLASYEHPDDSAETLLRRAGATLATVVTEPR